MSGRVRRAAFLAIAAAAAAASGFAATLESPLRRPATGAVQKRSALGQEALELDARSLRTLRDVRRSVVVDHFPIAPGETGTLRLRRFEVVSPDAQISVEGPDGPTSLALPRITHFSGTVDGEPDSRVYVGAQADTLVAFLETSRGTAYVGPDEAGELVVRAADSPLNALYGAEGFTCAEEDLPPIPPEAGAPEFLPRTALAPEIASKQAAVRVDTDQELLAKFGGNVTKMASYVLSLFGQANVAYERDVSLHLTVVEIHAWTTTDPYDGPGTIDQLNQLGAWWQANRPTSSYPRWTVHLLSGRGPSGGVAWLDVSCGWTNPYGYGVTQVYGSYSASNPWDYYAMAHELGHNAGSPHTHCFSPPIDHCYNGESGCYSGPQENPGAGNGTIMSYCHLLGWPYVSLVFHSRCVSEQMQPLVNGNGACMTASGAFADVPVSNMFYDFVEAVAREGISSGCGNGNYCPDASVTRAQMAVFLLKAKYGASHVPPPATGTVFTDVPANAFAAAWIEELASLGVTTGCSGGYYCPGAAVTRKQMAPFLLKALYGSSHVPPAAASVFSDVSNADPFEPWIMELYTLTVTGGCVPSPLSYCPDSLNTRGQMAAFLTKTFGLLTTTN